MSNVKINTEKILGDFKPLNCVNNGPVHKRHAVDQSRSNIETYKAARIPYARNHDAAFNAGYGGEHSVDISAIFPDFTANPYVPESYDFACTDEYILVTLEADTKTFFRLGQKIEHYIKKYGIYPPADFHKWAVVCEHIIRHYTKGWANGFKLDMPYWEIWNEPDLDAEDNPYKRTWAGTKAQFYDLYEVTAKHLKKCFPELKIGGPALAGWVEWAEDFINEMSARNVPIDFFSWHIYCTEPSQIVNASNLYREKLDKAGYTETESILNEWNYVQGWMGEEFIYSIEKICGLKGAAFIMACMSEAQRTSIDMLMYYDARPCVFNGMWDFYTLRPFKGYYPFLWYGSFYDLKEVEYTRDDDEIYVLSGIDENGKAKTVITYYTNNDNAPEKTVSIDFGRSGEYDVFAVDENNSSELIATTTKTEFTMKVHTILLICEK